MLEILHFVFSSFWVFAGTVILFAILVQGLCWTLLGIAAIIHGDK